MTTRSNGALSARAASLLRGLGWDVLRRKQIEGGVPFYNLLARRGPRKSRPLLLNTHTDTVPPGAFDLWDATGGDPFRLSRRGGFLFGLGVADVKLNLLCQIEAFRRLGNVPFKRPVVIAATYGEERGLAGARRFIADWRGAKPALALVGEPTEMSLIHRHRGYLVFEWKLPKGPLLRGRGKIPCVDLVVRGRSAHSSTPHLGINALEKSLALLRLLAYQGLPPRVVHAEGGTAHNQVPAEARLKILLPAWPAGMPDEGVSFRRGSFPFRRPVRLLPWESLFRLGEFSARLPASHSFNWALLNEKSGGWTVRFDLRFPPEDRAERLIRLVREGVDPGISVVLNDPPLHAPRRSPEMAFIRKVLRGAGLGVKMEEKLTCTEAGLYDAWGAPAAVIGPGRSTGNIHRPNERIALSQLEKAVRFYEKLIRQWIKTTS